MRDRLRTAILRDFSRTERLLVVLWYAERLTPGEVALVLDLTEDQTVRIHESIISRLNASLGLA